MRGGLRRGAIEGRRVLRGGSMAPLLREGDLVEIAPLEAGKGRAGDVIAFSSARGAGVIVHRIVRRAGSGCVTRGDAAPAPDGGLVPDDRVIGRVVAAGRGERSFRVPGGLRGLVCAGCARLRRAGLRAAQRITASLRPLLPGAGWAAGLVPGGVRARVVRFEAGGRVERRILLGSRVAGRYDEVRGGWRVRIRYRPFVRARELAGE